MKTDRDKAPIMMQRQGNHLVPSSAFDAELVAALDAGKDIEVTLKQRRSLPQMRFYWATLGDVVRRIDSDRYPTSERLHDAIKMATGYVEQRIKFTGEVYYASDSVAFDKMKPDEFKGFMARAWRIIAEQFGFDPLALKDGKT
jgi:hypothetical protein